MMRSQHVGAQPAPGGWRCGLPALLALLTWPGPVSAGTIAVGPLPPLVAAGQFDGVGFYNAGPGNCTGVLISPQHVLTAAHCFFGGSGMGPMSQNLPMFNLPEFPGQPFASIRVDLVPGFVDMNGMGQGHRVVGRDLAIITLAAPIPGATFYPINMGQIPDERDPSLQTVKVGFGRAGNGEFGVIRASPSGEKRFWENTVDQFGDGISTYHLMGNRDEAPPLNTLVYDFDRPSDGILGSSNLENFFDELRSGAVGPLEGSPAAGDSGGPMFQRLDANSPWILVGITSSGSDSNSRFGNVAYDTRVRAYADFIQSIPEPSALVLGAIGCLIVCAAGWRQHRLKCPMSNVKCPTLNGHSTLDIRSLGAWISEFRESSAPRR